MIFRLQSFHRDNVKQMSSWQQIRATRALEHELGVCGIAFTEDGDVIFHVDGVSDVYTVRVSPDTELFCPYCECNGSIFCGTEFTM